MNRWIDISQRLDNQIPVWPGDTPFEYKLTWPMNESGSVNVGQVIMSTHTGTHIDAPFHFDNEGEKVLELDVNLYMGPARVIHLLGVTEINPAAFERLGVDVSGVSRLLIYTGVWKDRRQFPTSIPPVVPELAEFLASKGVRLLGVDLPSVDALDSQELPAHHALAKHGIHILEGLVLTDIVPGDYELAALPLALADGDGSPVRAVIRPL